MPVAPAAPAAPVPGALLPPRPALDAIAARTAPNGYEGHPPVADPEFNSMNLPIPGEDQAIPFNPNLPPSRGYVLPMLYFDMGPNNLFRLLRQGVVTAYQMGRTIAVPVFHR